MRVNSWPSTSSTCSIVSLAKSHLVRAAANYMPTTGLPWYFDLRDESRKGWEHFRTDELVYVAEVLERNMYASIFVPKENLGAKVWIEAHQVFSGERDGHYCAIIELLVGARNPRWNLANYARLRRVNRNIPVLIEIPQEVETPQVVGFISVPAIVRLKRLHQGDCVGMNTSRVSSDPFGDLSLCARHYLADNRKARFGGRALLTDCGKFPSKVIEGGAEIADKIASDQTNLHKFDSVDGDYRDGKQLPFKVFICHNSIQLVRLRDKRSDGGLQSVQVNFRPLHFEVSMLGYHDWPLLSEESGYAVVAGQSSK